jgi:hypothetical protein
LQEFEDDILTSGKISSANKGKAAEFIRKETSKPDEINDKMRLLLINILCGQDSNDIRNMIDTMKSLHGEHIDETFIETMLSRRSELE